jgi:hypothetical protein
MSSSDPVMRLVRLMTHFNIGAALGMAAWVLWSGWQVVNGQIAVERQPAEVQGLLRLHNAATTEPMQLVPVSADGRAQPPCHASGQRSAAGALMGSDL